MDKDSKLSMFLYILHKIDEAIKTKEKTITGTIYMLINDKDKLKYISSTLKIERTMEDYLRQANNDTSSKMHKHIKEKDANYDTIELYKKDMSIISEMYIYEDMYIYKYDTINTGLNMKYNYEISNKIIQDDLSIEEKYKYINEFINTNINMYNKRIEFLENEGKILKMLKDKNISQESKYWYKEGKLEIYNYLLLDNFYIKIENNIIEYGSKTGDLFENIYVIYMIFWPETEKYEIFYLKNGIKTLLKEENQRTTQNALLIDSINTNGLKLIIKPISYIRTKETNESEINKHVKEHKTDLENIIKLYVIKEKNLLDKITEIILVEKCKIENLKKMVKNAYNYVDNTKILELMEIITRNQKIKEFLRNTSYEKIVNIFNNNNKNEKQESQGNKKAKIIKLMKKLNSDEINNIELISTEEINSKSETNSIESINNNKNEKQESQGNKKAKIIKLMKKLKSDEINNIELIREEIDSKSETTSIESINTKKRKRGRPRKYKDEKEVEINKKKYKRTWNLNNRSKVETYNKKYYHGNKNKT